MVGHLLQYHPAFEKVLQIIDSDLLGRIKKVFSERMSFGKIRKEEDVIWSFAPHDISMILRIVKSSPTKVICNGTNRISENLYDEAKEIILRERKASTSFLQRKLQIGYNRAARIIDQMEENGEVSKANHVGKREVLKL